MNSEIDIAIGKLLRAFRKECGLTQRDVAARLEVSQSHICKIERAKRPLGLAEMFSYAKALGVTPEAFYVALYNSLKQSGLQAKLPPTD